MSEIWLQEQLRQLDQAKARIAELEGERDRLVEALRLHNKALVKAEAERDSFKAGMEAAKDQIRWHYEGTYVAHLQDDADKAAARVAKLEARLTSLVRYHDYLRSPDGPPNIRGGGEPPELAEARAALLNDEAWATDRPGK